MLQPLRGLGRLFGLRGKRPADPTVFHITHHKAGSQWVNRILHTLAYDRLVQPEIENRQFLDRPVRAGAVYPTLYVTREQFESVALPEHWRRFVVIRDLRDILISFYFSVKYSHAMLHDVLRARRAALSGLSLEDGLLHVLETGRAGFALIQWSWRLAGEDLIKYEDLLRYDEEILGRVLLRHCRLAVDPVRFREVVRAYRFETQTGGRKPGSEDVHSHERKGIAGDW